MSALSRTDTSMLSRWWWSVDRVMIAIIAAIVMTGLILNMMAGPGASQRLGIDNEFYFPLRQLLFLGPALAVMIGVSLLTPLWARRVGTTVFAVSLILVFLALVFAPPVNGAHRWIPLGSFSLQPSEFLKPGFIVVAAWMLAEGDRSKRFPGALIAMALFLVSAALLVLQPDYGQALLLSSVWAAMFFIAGWSVYWLVGLGFLGGATIAAGYYYSPHLAKRINGFINPAVGDNYQVDKSVEALANGGLAGRAPDAASVKLFLPDAQTDFIFAVAGEERGFLFCLFIMALFLALVIRAFLKAMNLKSVFSQVAVCGLGVMIGLQAFINMGVAMRALPAKGMTLPFISNGGSSLIAMGFAAGLILALTRVHGPARSRRELMP